MKLEGTLTALVTPFKDQAGLKPAVDMDALTSLVEWQLECGVHGLVVCGTSGESVTLDSEERTAVIKRVLATVKGRVPVIAGTGTNCTYTTVAMTEHVRKLGVDAALVVSPYYNKPTQEGLFQHFRTVADQGGLPVVLYNIPGRTGVEIQLETFERLADHPQIIAVKEATASATNLMQLRERLAGRLEILSGEDHLTYLIMAAGGRGVISASANVIPKEFVELTTAALAGRFEQAAKVQTKILPVCRALFNESNPAPAKAALKLMGRIPSDTVRLPLVRVLDSTREMLQKALSNIR